jgi:putative flippase GtrA
MGIPSGDQLGYVRIMNRLWQRFVKFGIVGGISTALAYGGFIGLLHFTNYIVAATFSWLLSVSCGFVLNRRITFGISGRAGRPRQLSLFIIGAAIQYVIAMAGYALLIGYLHVDSTIAFFLNLILTVSFSFVFLDLIVFRKSAHGKQLDRSTP